MMTKERESGKYVILCLLFAWLHVCCRLWRQFGGKSSGVLTENTAVGVVTKNAVVGVRQALP